jgi:hypothetical protein
MRINKAFLTLIEFFAYSVLQIGGPTEMSTLPVLALTTEQHWSTYRFSPAL